MGVFRKWCLLVGAVVLAGCTTFAGCATSATHATKPAPGYWSARVGEIPFEMAFSSYPNGCFASIENGEEEIFLPMFVPEVTDGAARWTLEFPHYDSRIEMALDPDGQVIRGTWTKQRAKGSAQLEFEALPIVGRSRLRVPYRELREKILGRWRVRFSSSEDPAVAVFSFGDGNRVFGTFLTTTGDYRYLGGTFDGERLRLSCFDGAHAFRFDARLLDDGSLSGEFLSGDWWRETWTAVRDPVAKLPDAFDRTKWRRGVALGDLAFPDLEGKVRSLDGPDFAGKARIVYVFGSWCPNCHDASRFLGEMWKKYSSRGLSITGLAFELTGDAERDARQVARYRERHEIKYPLLLAGTSDKKTATEQLGALDFVRSYPTTIFVRRDGTVRAIHTGFSGPATGKAYEELKLRFEALILELLADDR